MIRAIVLHQNDNVATLIDEGAVKAPCNLIGEAKGNIQLAADVPFGHKVALRAIKANQDVVKYGLVIGRATQDIAAGAHVHVHNVESFRGRGDIGNANKELAK